MSFYKTCPHCGAHLDPGESCDCTISQVCAEARAVFPELFTGRTDREIVNEITGVVRRAEMKNAPPMLRTLARAGRNRISPLFPPPL